MFIENNAFIIDEALEERNVSRIATLHSNGVQQPWQHSRSINIWPLCGQSLGRFNDYPNQ